MQSVWRLWCGVLSIVSLSVGLSTGYCQPVEVWQESWEDVWTDEWAVSAGVWQVATPTSGPGDTGRGRVAATIAGGSYPEVAESRLIRNTSFVVPPAGEYPRLRFDHWFSFGGGDWGRVEARVGTGDWQVISTTYTGLSGVWSSPSLDLRGFAGQSVQVAFHFYSSDCCLGGDSSTGWYIDAVRLLTGVPVFHEVEDFEEGIGDWWVTHGVWEVGNGVAVTVLDGSYPESQSSRLVSAPFEVPAAGEHPRLRFRHWFSFGGGDYGQMQIRVEGGSWQQLTRQYWGSSGIWTETKADLEAFAGQKVEFGLYHYSRDCCLGGDAGAGWWVDDLRLVTGPTVYNDPESFEGGLGDWWVSHGVWEVRDGVAVTVLEGNYPEAQSSRLISPPFEVPAAEENPRLRFRHWFSFGGGDYGQVQIRVEGGDWQELSRGYWGSSAIWTETMAGLVPYAGQRVELGLYHYSKDCCLGGDAAPGWWVDDLDIVTGPIIYNEPENFESGIGDWWVEHGVWEVRDGVAATVLEGNYPESQSSRLITSSFTVPSADQNPRLRFSHRFSFGGGDYGEVQIRTSGGQWEPLSRRYSGVSTVWSRPALDLRAYAGQSVKLAFLCVSTDCCLGGDNSWGWWVDDVEVATGTFTEPPDNQAFQDFEQGLGDWWIDNGVWEVGQTDSAYGGSGVAATVLNGSYPEAQSSRLISQPFVVPPAEELPRLRFWHWFSFGGGDYGEVQIRVDGGAWQPLSRQYWGVSYVWTYPVADLVPYAGQSVELGFYFRSTDCCLGGDASSGWWLDEVRIVTGPIVFDDPENFDDGLGDWWASHGVWEVRNGVAVTVLDGNYPESQNSRLISAPFVVPAAEENPRLRFRHWFSFGGGDYGQVHIRVEGGDWQELSRGYWGPSSVWTETMADLVPFAGQNVELGLYYYSRDCCLGGDAAPGWWVDDLEIVTGPIVFDDPENFDDGLGDWWVEHGVWEVRDGVAVTVREGNYPESQNSRLVSSPFIVPAVDEKPRLRFRHWFSFGGGDYGQVQIRVEGGDWQELTRGYWGPSAVWTEAMADLSRFAGQQVELALYYYSRDCCLGGDSSSGWWVDDLEIVTGPIVFDDPEDFEDGFGDWWAEHGVWEVQGGVAVTVRDGNYPETQNSRLISSPFVVPPREASPRLRFWHWFSFGGGDYGEVQIRVDGGSWEAISRRYYGPSAVWTYPLVNLTAYAGRTVELGFYYKSTDCCLGGDASAGWWLDAVTILQGPRVFSNPEDFEEGLGEWHAQHGIWQVGEVASGPGSAHSGNNVAATNLGGNYPESQNSRFVSSPLGVPSPGSNPSLRFWHWHSFGGGDRGEVQVRPAGGNWTSLATYTGGSGGYRAATVSLRNFGGKTVEIGFYYASGDCCLGGDSGPGWYIDDVSIIPKVEILFQRGDLNWDGETNITDVMRILNFVLRGIPGWLDCEKTADVDDSGAVDITDAVYLLRHQFAGGHAPPEPFGSCGPDETADPLQCASFGPCQ